MRRIRTTQVAPRAPWMLRRLVALGLVLGAAAGLLTASMPAGAVVSPGSGPRPVITGWLPYWSPSASIATVTRHADLFREASPFFFSTTARTVQVQGSSSVLKDMVGKLHAHHVTVLATFTTTMDADQFAAVLRDPAKRRAHVQMLVRAAAAYGADGVDLDYEAINFGSSAARDVVRARYPVLLRRLDALLGARHMLTSVTVPARTSDTDPNWWVYDYGALARYTDRFRVMTYDYHWSGGSAGPVAPRSWVDRVVGYAVTRVPAGRLSFGLPSYGYDWYVGTVKGRCGSSAKATVPRTSAQMARFAASLGIKPSWSAAQTSRTFSYRQRYGTGRSACVVRRVAWYDDARSFRAKLPLVAKYHLRGVAIWALGSETPVMWRTMHRFGMRVAVRATTVPVRTPDRVVYGANGRVRGTVVVGGRARAGVPVTLWQRPVGTTGWTRVATAPSRSNGTVVFPVSPRRHMQYQLRTPRAWAYTSGRSTVATTRVSYRVALDRTSARIIVPTSSYTVAGRVSPGASGVVVRKQLLRDGRWVTAPGRVALDGQGRFAVTVSARHPVTRTLRLVARSGPLDVGVSGLVRLVFR